MVSYYIPCSSLVWVNTLLTSPNFEVVKIQNDKILKESVKNSDIINADGMSIVWAVRFLGYKIQERVAGIDLMENLIHLAHKKNYSCFFLGAKKEVVENVVSYYSVKSVSYTHLRAHET